MKKNWILGALVVAASTSAFAEPPNLIQVKVTTAITKQIAPVNPKEPTVIELVTVVKSPLYLTLDKLKTPAGVTVVSSPAAATPSVSATAVQDVKQRWEWKLKGARVSGDYMAAFHIQVVKGAGIPSTNVYVAGFKLQ